MTDKAYIVANEQQEREVLEKLEQEGLLWISGRKATEWIPSQRGLGIFKFPYSLVDVGYVAWRSIKQLENYEMEDEEIVFDGRKEEKMSDKYVVSQKFMTELEEWKNNLVKYNEPGRFIDIDDLEGLPFVVNDWWEDEVPDEESNNRLIAIIRWVNGEDVFEVEKHKKWVVRSKQHNNFGEYTYVTTDDIFSLAITIGVENATRFNTKEEAESWANAHQEVVQVEVEE